MEGYGMPRIRLLFMGILIFTNSFLSAHQPNEHQLKKYDFFMQLAQHALVTGETESYNKVPKLVADIALTDIACTGITKYTGAKKYTWNLPFLAVTGAMLVKHVVKTCKQGAVYKKSLQARYGKYKWPLALIVGIMLPQMVRAELTNATFNKVCQKTGLASCEYPAWILRSTILTLIAWQLQEAVAEWCGNVIGSVYEWVVPPTNTERIVDVS